MITIGIKGLSELRAKFSKLKTEAQTELRGIMERGAQTFVRNAKRDAPVDLGVLKNEISYAQTIADSAHITFEVISNAKYSPYLEWGTITKVSVPAELAEYAAQFKGRGIRKTGGIFPHPFFFKQSGPVQAQLETDIKNFLNGVDL